MKQNKSRKLFLFLAAFLLLALILACGKGTTETSKVSQPTSAGSQPSANNQSNASSGGSSGTQSNILLFKDDFQDGQADNWNITKSWDVQQNGDVYTFEASNNGGAWLPQGLNWSNYAFQTQARLDQGSLLLSINMTEAGRYILQVNEDGLFLLKEQPAGKYKTLAKACPWEMGEWHKVVFGSQNGHLQVYVDSALWMDAIDNSPLSMGTISVSSLNNSKAGIDDVLVAQLTKPLVSSAIKAPTGCKISEEPPEIAPEESLAEIPIESAAEQANQAPQSGNAKPDLIVTDAYFEPAQIVQGQSFVANFVIKNQGDADSGAFTLRWGFHDETGLTDCNWDYNNLAPGETVWGGCVRNATSHPGTFSSRLMVDVNKEIKESDENNNIAEPTLIIKSSEGNEEEGNEEEGNNPPAESGLPDLILGDIGYEPDPVVVGQPFTIHYLFINQGEAGSGAFTLRLVFPENAGVSVCSNDYSLEQAFVPVGECTRTINASPGNYKVTAIVDVENEIAESNENNNKTTFILKVVNPDGSGNDEGGNDSGGLPDLVISMYYFEPDNIFVGEPVTGIVTIENWGDAESGPFQFKWTFNNSSGIADCIIRHESLPPGGRDVVMCEGLTATQAGNFSSTLQVDAQNSVNESDKSNNKVKAAVHVKKK